MYMGLAIAMLVAYLPFCWWIYNEVMEDIKQAKTERHEP